MPGFPFCVYPLFLAVFICNIDVLNTNNVEPVIPTVYYVMSRVSQDILDGLACNIHHLVHQIF